MEDAEKSIQNQQKDRRRIMKGLRILLAIVLLSQCFHFALAQLKHSRGVVIGGVTIFDDKPVKGAPYSAEAVDETIQTLPDGNRIVKRNISKIYRDSEGRTRRESGKANLPILPTTVQVIGAELATARIDLAQSETQTQIIINDPVLGVYYVLDPQTKTAQTISESVAFNPTLANAVEKAKVIVTNGNTIVDLSTAPEGSYPIAPEPLGWKNIEGVECEGQRMSMTIPAGQMGNEMPITITVERWRSPKLQADVLVINNDPRSGEHINKLINISQSEPPISLFQIPAEYSAAPQRIPAAPAIQKNNPKLMMLNYKDADLRDFINQIAPRLGIVPIVIDPEVKGKATLRTPSPMSKDDVLPLFHMILKDNNAALISQGDQYQVVPMPAAVK
jgi:hypothetical protein